ncbi:hypothetical protein FRC03_011188 [Tulasnella sp. 419]|nr:hypothetical protein FRC03_011188 [Tulasnella sp. 419]
MVRVSVLALFALSVTSVLARPTHHRRQKVCRSEIVTTTSVKAAAAEATPTTTTVPGKSTSGKKGDKDDDKDKEEEDDNSSGSDDTTTDDNNGGDNNSSDTPASSGNSPKSLFPVSFKPTTSWSTSNSVSNSLPLSPGTLKAIKGNSNINVVDFQGKSAIKAFFKKGSINPGNKNAPAPPLSFYAAGPKSLEGDHVIFSYSVFFEEGFAFNKGGKLPGLFGGTNNNVATTCSGGRHDGGCWSTRFMWRDDGEGELYGYLPLNVGKNKNKCGRNATGVCKSEYGMSIGTGKWKFVPGQWTTISQRVKLNSVGQSNGQVEVYINGKSVLLVDELTIRTENNAFARGFSVQSFFGGHDKSWECPKDQNVYFSEFSAAVIV